MKTILSSLGPALIVAAVVLGPGSILTSSKVGSSFGLMGVPVLLLATVLMIGMVALSARLGAIYQGSPCDELAARLGRPFAVFIGVVLFLIVALFQSSNNIALIGGIEPMLGDEPLPLTWRFGILIAVNVLLIGSLYITRDLYRLVERLMKFLIGMMTVAFFVNFAVAMMKPRNFEPVESTAALEWLPLMGMIGTTFSVGGAFYQAYLVKEKGWGLDRVRTGVVDSVVGISMLGGITAVILLTAWRVFYGNPDAPVLASVGDVARQLEPLFGPWAKYIFSLGILAGALSSFLVNALIGGTVLSDSLGSGSSMQDRWPLHWTAVALLVGMGVALASLAAEDSTVHLITLAQALTVIGNPAIAGALLYLGTRPHLTGERKVPTWILALGLLGFLTSCFLAYRAILTVVDRLG